MASKAGIKAGAAFVELKSKDSDFIRGMKRAQRRLESFGQTARKVGAGLAAGGGSIVGAGLAASKVFAKVGDDLDKISARTGIAVESLSALGFGAEQSGASLEQLEKGIQGMQRALYDASRGLATQVESLDRLGLSVEQLQQLSPEQQFIAIGDALSKVSSMSDRAAISMQIFGRAGRQLLPLFADGAAGIEAYRMQAEQLGLIISTSAASSAAELTDTLNIMSRVIRVLVFEIGGALAPSLIKAATWLTRTTKVAIDWVRANRELVASVFKVAAIVVAAGGALIGLGIAAAVVAFAIGGLVSLIGVLGAVVGIAGAALAAVLSPIGLVAAAIVALGVAVYTQVAFVRNAVGFILDVLGEMLSGVLEVLGAIGASIMGGQLGLAVEIAGAGMALAWAEIMAGLRLAWLDFIDLVATKAAALPQKINGILTALEVGVGFLTGDASRFGGAVPRLPDTTGAGDLVTGANDAKRNEIRDSLDKLRDALDELVEQAPQGGLGRLTMPEVPQLPDFAGGGGGASRTVSGLFQSNALRNLASPVEESIRNNTAKAAKTLASIDRKLDGQAGVSFA